MNTPEATSKRADRASNDRRDAVDRSRNSLRRPRAPRTEKKAGHAVNAEGPERLLRRGARDQERHDRFPGQRGHGADRAVGIRKIDGRPVHQPHARGDPRRAGRGQRHARRARRVQQGRRRHRSPPADRDGVPEAEPVPDDVDLRQRRRGAAADRDEEQGSERPRPPLAAGGRSVGRGQGPARLARDRSLRRTAAAPVHRADGRGRARGDPDGRARVRARSDLHAQDRGADRRAQGALHDRDRHPQHAAGGAHREFDRVHARGRGDRA